MKEIFALADCNNFYVSCERVFNRRLEGRGVIVLSNNDGCVVSRSNEVKALGVGMGVAVFKVRDIIEKNNIEVFSSNYPLYADLSRRVMQTLSALTAEIEIYSIDEAFLNLAGLGGDLVGLGREIRATVKKWTGIPVSIGIARTKTLAKVANKIAKRFPAAGGVFDLTDAANIDEILKSVAVEDIWGIGIRSAIRLKRANINTALELKNADINWIKSVFGTCGARVVYELRGIKCYSLQQNPPAAKSVLVSRTFANPIESLDNLRQAVASFAARAGEKLRQDNLFANVVTIFVATNRFNPKTRYFNSIALPLPEPTNYSPQLISTAVSAVSRLYRRGYKFKKAGVVLTGLVADNIQRSLFDAADREKSNRLMRAVDIINSRYPDSGLYWAAEDTSRPWQGRRPVRRSRRFTTCWEELPEVA